MSGALIACFPLGSTFNLPFVVQNPASNNAPINADSLPTYRTYDSDVAGFAMSGGSGDSAKRHTFTVSGAANNGSGLGRITTSAAHNLATGQIVTISGISGATGCNGTFAITVISSTTFDLVGSTFGGTYTSGGTGNVTGFYYAAISVTTGNGFGREKVYPVAISYAISSVLHTDVYYFQVV